MPIKTQARRTGVMQIVELGVLTCVPRKWQGLRFSVIKKGVEYEVIFSLWLVFLRGMVGSVGGQSLKGENSLGF